MQNSEVKTSTDAYLHTMEVIQMLREDGVKVKISQLNLALHQEAVERYGEEPDRVDPFLWVNVSLMPYTDRQCDLIFSQRERLEEMGISFDTGGCSGEDGVFVYHWSLDWSFQLGEPFEKI